VRLPGGVCTPTQWLKLDELARAYGQETLRLTTRQTFQFHWLLKHDLRATLQGLQDVLLDTIAACGDDARAVMCSVNPHLSALHAEVYDESLGGIESLVAHPASMTHASMDPADLGRIHHRDAARRTWDPDRNGLGHDR
jgi:sulfite reductase beta subunit-like hemoprotein